MLILVRHGRTQWNAEGRLQGRHDTELDEVGKEQAAAIALALENVDRVVCSPLQRARITAEQLGRPVSVDDRWIELDYGVYDGMPLGEVPREFWERWRRDPELAPPGGETHNQLRTRVWEACLEVWEEARDSDVAVVSHVTPIKAAVAWALGLDRRTAWRTHLDVASISRIGHRGSRPMLISFNEIHHLPGAKYRSPGYL